MHTTKVVLKDGEVISGVMVKWRPQEGWFSLGAIAIGAPVRKIQFEDVESAVTFGQRVSLGKVEDRDELKRYKEQVEELS